MGKSKGPSSKEIANQQSVAAEKERAKIALEQAEIAAQERQDLQTAYADKAAQQSFVAGIAEDETQRRKFLKGV